MNSSASCEATAPDLDARTSSTLSSLGNSDCLTRYSCRSDSLQRSLAGSLPCDSLRRKSDPISDEVSTRFIEASHDRQHRVMVQKSTRGLTIDKLNIHDMESNLVGREEEKSMLEQSLARAMHFSSRELVLIRGHSGTGKSSLGFSIRKTVSEEDNALFVVGKFDYSRREPYSGVAAFGREICGALFLMTEKEQQRSNGDSTSLALSEIVVNLTNQLGDDLLALLVQVVPEVEDLLESCSLSGYKKNENTRTLPHESSANATQSHQRFNHAFRLFIRLVCCHCKALVILLDDLQWADSPSIDVLEVLLTDNENKGLLIIGCYRTIEDEEDTFISDSPELNVRLSKLKEKAYDDGSEIDNKHRHHGFGIQDIQIGNLSLDQTLHVIMALLTLNSQDKNQVNRTLPLAAICHKRTRGNPFFLLSFLYLLQQQSFLTFNLGTLRWNWTVERIEEETTSTENIVQVTMKNIVNVHPELGKVMQIASLLGSRFNEQILFLVWGNLYTEKNTDYKKEEIVKLLAQAIEQNYIEQVGNKQFQWAHDKIQEAAMALVPADDQSAFKFDVGMILAEKLDRSELDSQIFIVVDLLDSKTCSDTSVNLLISKLSAAAAKKARSLSAFSSAAKYASIGINNMSLAYAGEDDGKYWETSYDLILELHCIAVESESVLGNDPTKLNHCSDIVLSRGRTVLDKIPVYYALALSLGKAGQFADATDLISDAVNQLGVVKIPKHGAVVAAKTMSGLLFTKKVLLSRNVDDFPVMTDAKQIATQRLLDLLSSYAFQADKMLLLLYSTIKMVSLAVDFGISSWAPSAIAQYGALVSGVLNDLPAGVHICEMALGMVTRLKGQANEALVIARTWGFTLGYSRPSHDALKQFLHGYTEGLKFGDTEMSSWCLFNHVAVSFCCGKKLQLVAEDCEIYIPYIQGLGWSVVGEATAHVLEAVSYLTSKDEESYSNLFIEKEGKQNFQDLTTFMCRSAAYTYSADYKAGAAYALKAGDTFSKGAPGHALLMSEIFTRGVCLYAMARETGKGKFKRPARVIRKTIKNLVQQGSLNQKHQLYLLNAEDEALSKKKRKASISYREGIIAATRGGFLRDAALINERYANFLLRDVKDPEQAAHYAKDSIKCYQEWGAVRTVENLTTKYSDILKDKIPAELIIGRDRSSEHHRLAPKSQRKRFYEIDGPASSLSFKM